MQIFAGRLTQTNKITRKSFQQQFRKIPLC